MSEPDKELSAEIAELERYIEDLWKFFPTPLAFLNPLGIIMDADQALLAFLGYDKGELIGRSLYDLSPQPEEIKKIIKSTLEQGQTTNQEAALAAKARGVFRVALSAMTRKDEQNNIFGLFVSLIDLSQAHKDAQALKERAVELEKMNKFMVGRELDMIGLKKEVNALLRSQGKPDKYQTI